MTETDCEHEWEPLEFEDGEKSKAQVCSKCGALKSGQGSIVITANYIDLSPLTADPTLAEGRQWFRSDLDSIYWSPDGSIVERMETYRPGVSGSLAGIKGFEYLIEGAATDSWDFTMNPSVGVWIKQYSTAASFNAQMVYHGAYQHWTGDNTFVDVPNKAENVYGAGEEVTVHQIPDGTEISSFPTTGDYIQGVAWDGEYVWGSYGTSTYVYKYKKDGTVVSKWASPGAQPYGVTWDGFYLWLCDRVAPCVYQMTTGGSQVSSFPVGYDTRGIAWDGEYLFVKSATNWMYKYTPGGTEVATITTTGIEGGLGWDGQYFWNSFPAADGVYQLKQDGTDVSFWPTSTINPRSCGWDGSYLWAAEDASGVYQYGATGNFDLDYRIAPA